MAVLLGGRFVRDAQGQYRRNGETRVALADEGGQIRFVDKQMDAFEAGVELAKAKGWMTIEVTGSEKFKEQAWFHASVSGLEVVGFEPTEAALARLAQAKQQRAQQTPSLLAGAAEATPGVHSTDPAAGAPQAHTLGDTRVPPDELLASRQDAQKFALFLNRSVRVTDDLAGRYVGRLIHETQHHVVQDLGRNVAVLHQKAALGGTDIQELVGTSANVRINYHHGRGAVDIPVRATPEHAR
ncbi:MAG: LPD7 domain-containing protein [Rhodococcus sp. (in: high G+C Gram-positive bacteria)]|uniref:LPD7 domain-containing protein n=1 Tax=Rhodococcus sp. TaxID=1831 RepID=UPI002ADC7357|nr:LPD7 domain-containing protein [Rhodococcus sp. (in: high G+C Gram-positive bacteria)]